MPEERVPVPRVVVPSRKVTVPVGVPVVPAAPAVEAVKVTLLPVAMVVAEAVSVVVLAERVGLVEATP